LVDKCACMSVVAFGEIKRLQRVIAAPTEALEKPTKLEIEVAENQLRNAMVYVSKAEEECKVDMGRVRDKLVEAMQAFRAGEAVKAVDKVIDADVQLRLAICPKEG